MYKNHGLTVHFFSFQTLLSFQSKYILRHSVTLCQMKLIFDEHEVGKRGLLMFFMYFQSKNIRDPNPIKNNCNFLTTNSFNNVLLHNTYIIIVAITNHSIFLSPNDKPQIKIMPPSSRILLHFLNIGTIFWRQN